MKFKLPDTVNCPLCGNTHEVRKPQPSDVIDPLEGQKGLVNCENTGRVYEVTEEPTDD